MSVHAKLSQWLTGKVGQTRAHVVRSVKARATEGNMGVSVTEVNQRDLNPQTRRPGRAKSSAQVPNALYLEILPTQNRHRH